MKGNIFLFNTFTIPCEMSGYKIMMQYNQNNDDACHCRPISTPKVSLIHASSFSIMLGSVLLLGGCDNSAEYAERSADMESVQSATEEAADSGVAAIMSDVEADEASNANDLEIKNLSSGSEQTLGSQTEDVQIAGKKLLITASANFKVKDVVKSSNAIESLTRQKGGYVALSHINNYARDSQTFVQGDKNITITTYTRQADMTVRIPRVNVNKFLNQVQQQVSFLNEQQLVH